MDDLREIVRALGRVEAALECLTEQLRDSNEASRDRMNRIDAAHNDLRDFTLKCDNALSARLAILERGNEKVTLKLSMIYGVIASVAAVIFTAIMNRLIG